MNTLELPSPPITVAALPVANATEPPDARQQAEGYLELGLPIEAWQVLKGLPLDGKDSLPVLLLHLRILVAEKAWPKVDYLAGSILKHKRECAAAWYAFAQSQAQQGREVQARWALKRACDLNAFLAEEALKDELLAGVI